MKKYLSIILLSTLITIYGCKKEENSKEYNNVEISAESVLPDCVSPHLSNEIKKEYVIRTQSALNELLSKPEHCDTNIPEIDFTKYTLIGKYAAGSCYTTFERSFKENAENNSYLYKVTVHSEGDCYLLSANMNWVLVPKLPEDAKVEFVVNYK